MASTGILGAGVKLGYGATPTYLAEVLDITPPETTVDKVDSSNHDSPSRIKEQMPGWLEFGDATADIIYNKTDAATIRTKLTGRVAETWTILFSDGSTLVFTGFLTQLGHTAPLKDKMLTKVGLCVSTGTVVFTPGS